MGIHTIQGVPQDIAIHNNLDDPLLYTSHSLRVSAATALAEKGATALQLQNFGGWKSIAVAEGYIRESAKTKKDIALLLSGAPKEDTTKQDATGPFLLSGTTEKDSTNQDATDPPADEPKTPTKIKQSFVNTVQSNKTHSPTKIMGNITNKTIYVNNVLNSKFLHQSTEPKSSKKRPPNSTDSNLISSKGLVLHGENQEAAVIFHGVFAKSKKAIVERAAELNIKVTTPTPD
ncbi:hypothetical protein ACTFIY_011020 [Dictyostelium cf. discoideum]